MTNAERAVREAKESCVCQCHDAKPPHEDYWSNGCPACNDHHDKIDRAIEAVRAHEKEVRLASHGIVVVVCPKCDLHLCQESCCSTLHCPECRIAAGKREENEACQILATYFLKKHIDIEDLPAAIRARISKDCPKCGGRGGTVAMTKPCYVCKCTGRISKEDSDEEYDCPIHGKLGSPECPRC